MKTHIPTRLERFLMRLEDHLPASIIETKRFELENMLQARAIDWENIEAAALYIEWNLGIKPGEALIQDSPFDLAEPAYECFAPEIGDYVSCSLGIVYCQHIALVFDVAQRIAAGEHCYYSDEQAYLAYRAEEDRRDTEEGT